MDKYITDERTGLKYELVGDYYFIAGDDEPEERHIPSVRINLPEAILAFKKWADKTDKIEY